MIKGGYILQPRVIQESEISTAPPYVREIWSYLLREANSQEIRYNGHRVKRGQLFRSYAEIREALKWYIGWRRCIYTEMQTKKAMKFLRDTGRIDTRKELGGVLITILKYEYYQNPNNYERTKEGTKERATIEPNENQTLPDNNKNDKNNKNNKEERKKEEEVSETAVSVAKNDFLDRVISEFSKVYEMSNGIPYVVVNRGKERTAAGKLIKEFKKVHPDYDSEQALRGMAVYFDRVININDAWIHDHMSLPTLISKFNEINNILRNGKSANNKGGTTKQLNEILSSHLTSQ
ncbi:MAG TPA: hypothetical protein PKH02_06350 [Bacteroidales bacterium]|nr:hypothetical protein [Bacteroidales bacterium]